MSNSKVMVSVATQTDPTDDGTEALCQVMEGYYRQQHERMLQFCEEQAMTRARAQVQALEFADRNDVLTARNNALISTVEDLQTRNIALRHEEGRYWDQVVALVDAIESFRQSADDNNRWMIMNEIERATARHGVTLDILEDTEATESDMDLTQEE